MASSKIKEEFKVLIRRNDDLKLLLAKANHCKVASIDRWLRENVTDLTTFDNLEILKEHFGLLEAQELLEKEAVDA